MARPREPNCAGPTDLGDGAQVVPTRRVLLGAIARTYASSRVGFWITYLLIALLAWAFKFPWLALAALAIFFLRNALPDPLVWLSTLRRVRELRARADALPADVLTRRDLARLLLQRGHAREAERLLVEAVAKGLRDPEAFHLLGLARLMNRDPEGALDPFVRAVAGNDRFLMGDPYVAAAEALTQLSRFEEAEDALERALAVNSSRVDAQVLLAKTRAARGDSRGARSAYEAAMKTWKDLPDFLRWKMLPHYVAARFAAWFAR